MVLVWLVTKIKALIYLQLKRFYLGDFSSARVYCRSWVAKHEVIRHLRSKFCSTVWTHWPGLVSNIDANHVDYNERPSNKRPMARAGGERSGPWDVLCHTLLPPFCPIGHLVPDGAHSALPGRWGPPSPHRAPGRRTCHLRTSAEGPPTALRWPVLVALPRERSARGDGGTEGNLRGRSSHR